MNSEIKGNEGKFKLTVLGALLMIVCAFVVQFVASIPLAGLLGGKYISSHKILESIAELLINIIPRILVILVILKVIRKDYKANFKINYIRKFNFKLLLCTVFLMIGFFLWFQTSFVAMIEKFSALQSFAEGATELDKNFYVDIIVSMAVAPIYEEILMRGIILEGFLNRYKPITAIIISSVIFGAMHLNILMFVNATIGAIIFGTIYYKTKSLVLSIACHIVHNLIINFVQYFGQYIKGFEVSIITFLIGIAIFVTAIVFFKRCLKKLDSNDANLKKNIA